MRQLRQLRDYKAQYFLSHETSDAVVIIVKIRLMTVGKHHIQDCICLFFGKRIFFVFVYIHLFMFLVGLPH